jgi:hypothetical protein
MVESMILFGWHYHYVSSLAKTVLWKSWSSRHPSSACHLDDLPQHCWMTLCFPIDRTEGHLNLQFSRTIMNSTEQTLIDFAQRCKFSGQQYHSTFTTSAIYKWLLYFSICKFVHPGFIRKLGFPILFFEIFKIQFPKNVSFKQYILCQNGKGTTVFKIRLYDLLVYLTDGITI